MPSSDPAGSGSRLEHRQGWHYTDWSDFRIELVISGEPVILKNTRELLILPGKGGQRGFRCHSCGASLRPSSRPSKVAQLWTNLAIGKLKLQWWRVQRQPIPKGVFLNAAIVSWLPKGKRGDSSNLYQAPEDALTKAGVIADDHWIRTHNGSDRMRDRHRPRVEIVLTPYRPTMREEIRHAQA